MAVPAVVMLVVVRMRLGRVDVRAGVGMLVDEATAMPVSVAAQQLVGPSPHRGKASCPVRRQLTLLVRFRP